MCPSPNDEQLKLCQAKNVRQLEKCRRENFASWGGGLSEELYMERENFLASSTFSKARQKTWILLEASKDQLTSIDILASCETYSHDCLISWDGETVVEGSCLSVASVFTPERHRKKGHASFMLKSLLERARSMEGVIASSLYSDIGPIYYSKLGWEVSQSNFTLFFDLENSKEFVPSDGLSRSWKYLELFDCKPIIQKESNDLKEKIRMQAKAMNKPVVSLLPSFEAFEWLWMRSLFYSKSLAQGKELKYCGIQSKNSSDFALFIIDYTEKILKVTIARLSIDTGAILLALAIHAKEWNLKRVEIWDHFSVISDSSAWKSLGWIIEERGVDHLASLCLQFPSSKPGDALSASQPHWLFCEKLYWV